ncbi:uncharacterized protein METZ01_LOCUS90100 [marine metagenome]|uniref:Flavin reductase like domain-containing protein n=1 Tax=marine metagenome TaxID=408172 RepID=A0A381VA44_9ZZZZ
MSNRKNLPALEFYVTDTTTKEEIKIRPFWYSDIWIFPKLINIITTLDTEGRVNAAPYSFIMQYDVMSKNPRMILGFRQDSHTYINICNTGEFVINCPSADYIEDMMETARFYPAGVNELEQTRFTMIPSRKVKPPSILESPQIAECTLEETYELPKSNGIVIAKIETIVMDKGLKDLDRGERIKAMNLPIGLGDDSRRYYYHSLNYDAVMHELEDPPDAYRAADAATSMEWDTDALQSLMQIPPGVRKMVTDQTENFAREKGDERVTMKRFTELAEEAGMDEEFLNRFRSKSDT